uniref:uncharacterized protein LOC105353155 n=1 Tax=Fragaria vesca subsp. vesca TaxID=101020 RepID=UPI0005CA7BAD|nr:PREDICTED: uncharacterized protein LOC105353155 [Fragaria vesca subsp. vesca]
MEPLLSMKDFEGRKLRLGSFLDILGQVACVAREKHKRRREETTINIKIQRGCSSSSTPKIKVVEAASQEDNVDDHDMSSRLKKQKIVPLQVNALYSVGTITSERSLTRFQEKNGLAKKKSNDGGENDRDWSLKPNPRNMNKRLGLKRPKGHIPASTNNSDPNDLPEELKRKIETLEGIESFEKAKMYMVIEKQLFQTDMAKSANRLSMPLKQIKPESFLDKDEIKFLADQNDWLVSVISPKLEDEALTFRQWDMPKNNGGVSSSYVLKQRWNEVRNKNGLQKDDLIQVWSFRDVGNNLHFALVLLDMLDKAKEGGSRNYGVGCSLPSSQSTTAPRKSDVIDGERKTCDSNQVTETKDQEMIQGDEINEESSRKRSLCGNEPENCDTL